MQLPIQNIHFSRGAERVTIPVISNGPLEVSIPQVPDGVNITVEALPYCNMITISSNASEQYSIMLMLMDRVSSDVLFIDNSNSNAVKLNIGYTVIDYRSGYYNIGMSGTGTASVIWRNTDSIAATYTSTSDFVINAYEYMGSYTSIPRIELVKITGNGCETYFTLVQTCYMPLPLWYPTSFSFDMATDTSDFGIYEKDTNKLLYEGRVFNYNGKGNIRINEIAQSFVESEMPISEFEALTSEFRKDNTCDFYLVIDDAVVIEYIAYGGYDYKTWFPSGCILAEKPVSKVFHTDAPIAFSLIKMDSLDWQCRIANGNDIYFEDSIGEGMGLFTFYGLLFDAGHYTVSVYTSGTFPQVVWEFDVVECGEWTLLYQGLSGGYGTLALDSPIADSDSIATSTIQIATGSIYNYEQKTYMKSMQRQYKFNTGWITDEQAQAMRSAIETCKCALFQHTGNDYTVFPCIITEASYEEKKNRSTQLVNYTFTVKESKKKINRI